MSPLKIDTNSNSPWGNVILSYKKKDHFFTYHAPTGEIFNTDSKNVLRLKCTALIVATPVVTLARTVYWLATAILMTIGQFFHYLDNDKFQWDWTPVVQTAYDSVRAVTYGFRMTAKACSGICKPLDARLRYGHLEAELNRHPDGPHSNKFYLAFCFQRLYILPNPIPSPEILDAAEKKLTKYISFIDRLQIIYQACEIKKFLQELRLIQA